MDRQKETRVREELTWMTPSHGQVILCKILIVEFSKPLKQGQSIAQMDEVVELIGTVSKTHAIFCLVSLRHGDIVLNGRDKSQFRPHRQLLIMSPFPSLLELMHF